MSPADSRSVVVSGLRRASASHAGQQLAESERFGQVVVGAGVEPGHPFIDGVERGQQEDGRVDTARSQQPQDLHALDIRKESVEHDDVVVLSLHERQRGHSVVGDIGAVALSFEHPPDGGGDLGFVFDDEYTHAAMVTAVSPRGNPFGTFL